MASNAQILGMGGAVTTPLNMTQSGPSIPGMDPAIDNIFPSRKRYIMEPDSAQLFALDGTSAARGDARIKRPRRGEVIDASGSPLDGFKTGLARTPYLHTPITVPQRIVNQKKPYTRFVHRGAKDMPVTDVITKGCFAFLRRAPIDARQSELSTALRQVIDVSFDDGSSMSVDLRPMALYSPAVLNYYLYMAQRLLYEEDPEKFYAITAADIMAEWSFDGLVIAEEMANGAESGKTSGFALHGNQWLGGEDFKVATINMAGEDMCANVFGAQVMHGSELFFTCKKYDVDGGGFHFNLNSKSNSNGLVMMQSGSDTSILSGAAMRLRNLTGRTGARAVGAANGKSRVFRPWLIAFVSQPDGQQLAYEHIAFTDENDVRRYDTYRQHIGRTIIAPQGHEPRPHVLDRITLNDDPLSPVSDLLMDIDPTGSLYSSSASDLRPGVAVDAALGLDMPFIKIYLNPRGNNPINN